MNRVTQNIVEIELEPPADVPEVQRGDWFDIAPGDPLVAYLAARHPSELRGPLSWKAARLSQAAYIYQETNSRWRVVAKFYAPKTRSSAQKHARQELKWTQRARQAGLGDGPARAVRPLECWRGVLFLEYVPGLSLEDTIAVRRSQPGALTQRLEQVGGLLATLHTRGTRPDTVPDFEAEVAYALEVVDELAQHGVLQQDPVAGDGLLHLIEQWRTKAGMKHFTPSLIHGDATTTNFVFPTPDQVVAIDWERLGVADPAADLGRLMAEVSYSVSQHGGSVAEAIPFVQHLATTYRQALPDDKDPASLLERARFYQASSTLRIARNGWISRLGRISLVTQAFALLSGGARFA